MNQMQTPSRTGISEILRQAVREYIDAQDGLAKNSSPDAGHPLAGPADPRLSDPHEIFHSVEAESIKAEIIHAGAKLWTRQYVDGNGGNLSVRIGEDYAICTPTLCSKGDLTEADFSLVDLENRQLCGRREPTSEILLHLEIYKAVPQARAVIHCHPPYATAYALAGIVPPGNLIPEQEVFVGPVALAPYETPGTMEFARTVLPFVKTHNTILLQNHGIVCWADSIAHAEWYVEVVENYCKIVRIALGIASPLQEIPPEKIEDLLRRKRRMGLPDPRIQNPLPPDAAALDIDRHVPPSQDTLVPVTGRNGSRDLHEDIEQLVASFEAQLLSYLKTRI